MPTTMRAQLEWSNAAPYAARTAVAAWLATIDCDLDTRHDVELVVSELVNRAVNDHIGAPELRAAFVDGVVELRVVCTESLGARVDADPVRLLGARILEAVSRAWGVTSHHGSTVLWADVPC